MNQEEFMQLFAQRSIAFFSDMNNLCQSYLQQRSFSAANAGLNGSTNSTNGLNSMNQGGDGLGAKRGDKQKKKVQRNPDEPKKSSSAYILYFKENKDQFQEKYQDLQITELTQLIGKDWSNLPPEKQQKYLSMAQNQKNQYEKLMMDYRQLHPEMPVPQPSTQKKPVKPSTPILSAAPAKPVAQGDKGILGGDDDEDDKQEISGLSQTTGIQQKGADSDDDEDTDKQRQFMSSQIQNVDQDDDDDDDDDEQDDGDNSKVDEGSDGSDEADDDDDDGDDNVDQDEDDDSDLQKLQKKIKK